MDFIAGRRSSLVAVGQEVTPTRAAGAGRYDEVHNFLEQVAKGCEDIRWVFNQDLPTLVVQEAFGEGADCTRRAKEFNDMVATARRAIEKTGKCLHLMSQLM